MKKRNPGDQTVTEIARAKAKFARRLRRKAERNALVLQKLRPLLVKVGALEQQIKTLTDEKRQAAQVPPAGEQV